MYEIYKLRKWQYIYKGSWWGLSLGVVGLMVAVALRPLCRHPSGPAPRRHINLFSIHPPTHPPFSSPSQAIPSHLSSFLAPQKPRERIFPVSSARGTQHETLASPVKRFQFPSPIFTTHRPTHPHTYYMYHTHLDTCIFHPLLYFSLL